jgi:N-acetylmuramoyl-L-alanine amidase
MSKLGFRNRGIKDGRNLYVVKNTYAKAILVELFFLDNYTDRKLYLALGADKIATAISEAIGK